MGKYKIGILEGDKEKIGFCLGNFWLIERVGLSKAYESRESLASWMLDKLGIDYDLLKARSGRDIVDCSFFFLLSFCVRE